MLHWIRDLLCRLFCGRRTSHLDHEREPPLPPDLGETTGGVGAGGTYVYVKGQLLVRDEHRDELLRLLLELFPRVRWRGLETEPLHGLGVTRLVLPRKAPSVPELMDTLRLERATSIPVAPNHVLGLTSHPGLIPCGPPVPVGASGSLEEKIKGTVDEGAKEVLVGVLDTGLADHPWLKKRCRRTGPGDVDAPDTDNDRRLDYGAGHGTFIAGVILQYAANARVLARRLKTTSTDPPPHQPYATDVELAQGLVDWSAEPDFKRLQVLVLAMGGYTYGGEGLLTTAQALVTCSQANPDLVVVAGAGNDDRAQPFYPAAHAGVVAVAALNESAPDTRACFSNQGSWVSACAPGVRLVSTFPAWQGAIAPYPPPDTVCQGVVPTTPTGAVSFSLTAEWRGTSFAAPIVAAWIAQRIATAGVTGSQAVAELKGTIGTAAAPNGLGQWLPDLGRVVRPPF
jgi:Subtilase family